MLLLNERRMMRMAFCHRQGNARWKTGVYIWHFDANGVWDESPTRVMYSEITNVTFSNRYVEVFANT